jgi:hypothetical protein
MGCANNAHQGKGNNCGKATLCPTFQDYGEQILAGMSQQTIDDSTVGPKLTIDDNEWPQQRKRQFKNASQDNVWQQD